jgi:gas vesicle protein
MSDRESGSSVILSFLLGGLTGAVLALLYAPRTGRETREIIGDRIRDGAEKGRELTDEAIKRGRDLKEQAVAKGREILEDAGDYVERQRHTLGDQKERLSAAVEAGRQAYREEKSKAKG